jgi:hypothetical protein
LPHMHLKAAKQFPRLSAADKVACEAEETAYRATPCPSTSKGGPIPTAFYHYLAVVAMERRRVPSLVFFISRRLSTNLLAIGRWGVEGGGGHLRGYPLFHTIYI